MQNIKDIRKRSIFLIGILSGRLIAWDSFEINTLNQRALQLSYVLQLTDL